MVQKLDPSRQLVLSIQVLNQLKQSLKPMTSQACLSPMVKLSWEATLPSYEFLIRSKFLPLHHLLSINLGRISPYSPGILVHLPT